MRLAESIQGDLLQATVEWIYTVGGRRVTLRRGGERPARLSAKRGHRRGVCTPPKLKKTRADAGILSIAQNDFENVVLHGFSVVQAKSA